LRAAGKRLIEVSVSVPAPAVSALPGHLLMSAGRS